MSTQKRSNFGLKGLVVGIAGEDVNFQINHLLRLTYIEDIKSASIRMEITLTDTKEGVLSKLEGLEPVRVQFEDGEAGEDHEIDVNLVVYDIQDLSLIHI